MWTSSTSRCLNDPLLISFGSVDHAEIFNHSLLKLHRHGHDHCQRENTGKAVQALLDLSISHAFRACLATGVAAILGHCVLGRKQDLM